MTPDQWVCPRLQHLNLFGARHLETASLATILQQSPGIKHLNLSEWASEGPPRLSITWPPFRLVTEFAPSPLADGCNTIASITITEEHAELATVEVSACKGLVSLQVASPALGEMQAKTCPRLQEVVLASGQLRSLDVSHCLQLQRLVMPAIVLPAALQQLPGPPVVAPAVPPPLGPPAVVLAVPLPRISTMFSERHLSPETLLQIRAIKAARRAEAAGEAAAARAADPLE